MSLEDLAEGRDWRMCEALLTLHAIADEACAGLVMVLDRYDGKGCLYRARGRELLARTGALARIQSHSLRVLPKVRARLAIDPDSSICLPMPVLVRDSQGTPRREFMTPNSTSESHVDDGHLISSSLRGDREASNVLLSRYRRLLYRLPNLCSATLRTPKTLCKIVYCSRSRSSRGSSRKVPFVVGW